MITKIETQLSKALVDKKIVSSEKMQPLLDEASKTREGFFTLLVKSGVASEEELLRNLAELMRVPFLDSVALKPDPTVAEKIPLKVVEYYKMVPIKLDRRKLSIAVSAPLDLHSQDDLRAQLGYEIEISFAREKDVVEATKRAYGFAAGTIGEMVAAAPALGKTSMDSSFEKVENIENIERLAGDASIAKLVNQIIVEAYRKRATDIHIEPYRGKVKLRYRIDGILYNAHVPAEMSRFILPVLSRVKIMSNLNIVERRLPQDGRAIVKIEDTQLDLRVSSIPTPYGESVVIRMLPMNRIFNLSQLGLSPSQLEIFETLINKPHGIIFITGPTGSGKSTTLYACLNKINTDERKIITIEDPVEYEMEGVTQIQVVGNIGLDFARGLRSMLRHDPDVMMVGEVRDLETAEIAIRVALTGHLVFSTLHTNDAASGITRLVEIGVEPYLVSSSVEAFIAQRLVRTICPHCKMEDRSLAPEVKRMVAREMGLKNDSFPTYRGKGCDSCNMTGFWGRIAIYELLVVNDSIKELIIKRAPSGQIKKEAIRHGMRTLRQDGWQKLLAGLTTPEEILEATQGDKDETETTEVPDTGFTPAVKQAGEKKEARPARDVRQFMRLSQEVTILYKVVKTPSQDHEERIPREQQSYTLNISAGGLLFVSRGKIPVGSILELKIELPEEPNPVECLARIVRQDESEKGRVFETAVYFLDLSSQDRTRLERFVEKEGR